MSMFAVVSLQQLGPGLGPSHITTSGVKYFCTLASGLTRARLPRQRQAGGRGWKAAF